MTLFTKDVRNTQALETTYAHANRHTMSGYEQCVDTLRMVCIDCGAETVLGLGDSFASITNTEHTGTEFMCPSPS